ncbi:MAG: hypothetical protein ACFE9Q_16795 [Candidatus Hodarchaeota archaeon]
MLNSITYELSQAKKLYEESKFKEALQIINDLEKKQGFNVQERFKIYYLKSSILFELGYMNKALKYVELAYKESKQLTNKFQIIDVLFSKISILGQNDEKNEVLKTIKKVEQILNTINQTSSMEFKEKNASLILHKGAYNFSIGELNRSLEYAAEGLTIAKDIKSKRLMMLAYKVLSFDYYLKGDIKRAYEYTKNTLALAKEINNIQEIIGALNSIGMFFIEKGEYDQAIDNLERSLLLCYEINSFKTIVVLSSLFEVYFYTNLEKAQKCLDKMKQFIEDNTEYKSSRTFYHLCEAVLLKKKPQKISHLKAKELLKQIIEKETPFSQIYYSALMELCDTYLIISSETNNIKILEEINPYFTQLKKIAKTQQSFWLLVETYSLQAKLKLIIFEFQEAQKLLSKALDIAGKYSLERLAKRILNEQDEFSKNFIRWEKLKSSNALISERMELARIDEQIEIMLQKRRYLNIIKS